MTGGDRPAGVVGRRPAAGPAAGRHPQFSAGSPPRLAPRRPPRFPDAATRRRVIRRRRQVAALVVLAVVAALVLGGLVLANVGDPPPAAKVRVALPAGERAPSSGAPATALPWPTTGEAAVAVPEIGYSGQSGPEAPVPVASMTKIMTAYVVLHDHPLRPGRPGPAITVTPTDAANFGTDTVTDQANVLVQAGETLTERQLLEGLLVHSADDLAFALADWDAGSVTAFVAKMNGAAARLGMTHTHFVDASGFDPASVSTAADLLKVAARCLADPVFAHIVTLQTVTLPLAGTVATYTPLLGTAGVVGVKSGFTTAAGGGDVLAYATDVAGHRVTALAAVTSQEGPTVLLRSGQEALGLAKAAVGRLSAQVAVAQGRRVGTATVDGRTVPLVTARRADLLVAPGQRLSLSLAVGHRPVGGDPAGTTVGELTVGVGAERVRVPVRTARPLPKPSLLARSW